MKITLKIQDDREENYSIIVTDDNKGVLEVKTESETWNTASINEFLISLSLKMDKDEKITILEHPTNEDKNKSEVYRFTKLLFDNFVKRINDQN